MNSGGGGCGGWGMGVFYVCMMWWVMLILYKTFLCLHSICEYHYHWKISACNNNNNNNIYLKSSIQTSSAFIELGFETNIFEIELILHKKKLFPQKKLQLHQHYFTPDHIFKVILYNLDIYLVIFCILRIVICTKTVLVVFCWHG